MTPRIDHYLKLWRLQSEGPPVQTPTGAILFARSGDTPCVLKVAHAHSDEATADALAHFQGRGSVKLLAREGDAVLMQRATPGAPLSDLVMSGADDEATTRIICATASALHSSGLPRGRFPSVEDWGAAFGTPAAAALDKHLVSEAASAYADLCATQTRRVLLHGDLHHGNILFDANSGWLAIDPKGVIGEPEFEAGCALRNPGDDPERFAVRDVIDRRVRLFCQTMGWSADRVLRWCYAQGVLSAIWSVEDGEDPTKGLAIARATRPMI